ncbi:MAG: hypothetical protein US62_C0009G0004 [Candidatus Woesebacteria bacterium GW2011_GWA1_37_8]|uniref:Pentapeptide repeat protein n=1 Tax=Candidatus Woesebacteria bacterium GW2011_GWA1_37_8 TaxID=1618546 RepID=A0A0G0HRI9_9BACT|nr:MAG: hypothetical protein US62_C0009G0004 [Candidatus Woesebacteria bacterium GW2011_GWA1_37_8]
MTGSNFENTDLMGTVFSFCNLEKVVFKDSVLVGCVFEKCNLKETDFSSANIESVNFENSKIDKTILDIEGFIKFGNSKGFVLSK